ncbi:TPA: hypothetical protein PGG59_005229 [Raoultella planticola]|nr:hypothetical protein [Raoultella planticola]
MKNTVIALGLCLTSLSCFATDSTWQPYDAVITVNDDVTLTTSFSPVTGLTPSVINEGTNLGTLSMSLNSGVSKYIKLRFASAYRNSGSATEGYMFKNNVTTSSDSIGVKFTSPSWNTTSGSHYVTASAMPNANINLIKNGGAGVVSGIYTVGLEVTFVI